MARRRVRYYSDEDVDWGVTPSQLKRFGKKRQVPYLLNWFHQNFEDPAESTPYVSAEGGYQWIWGGPYNARDALYNEFGSGVSEEAVEEAVEEIESDGLYDWAPSSWRRADDFEEPPDDLVDEPEVIDLDEIEARLKAGVRPDLGNDFELTQRRRALLEIDKLEMELPAQNPVHGGLGHNNPPPEYRLTEEDLALVKGEAASIRYELNQKTPDVSKVATSTRRMKKVVDWMLQKVDLAAEEFAKAFGRKAGELAPTAILGGLLWCGGVFGHLWNVVVFAAQWLQTVTLPF